MPTYDYICEACNHEFEEFQFINEEELTKCPECKKKKLVRVFGTGVGIIFKGSGFYETDYRSDSYKKSAASDKSKAASSDSSSSSETTSTKSESKSKSEKK